MKPTKQDKRGILTFMLPGLILFVSFFLIPVIYVLCVSFLKWNGMTPPAFVGVKNFATLFGDEVFRRSVGNNILWALMAGGVQVPLALLMALILSRKPRGWKLFRTVYFFPQVISGIALAMLWSAIYNSEYGLLNAVLKAVGLGHLARNWLGDTKTAFPCLLIYWVFYIGYYMVIMMSEISTVDETYYEAAEIDGASKIQQDLHITLPMIKNSILTCVTLATVLGLRQFEQVYLLTNGGPFNKTSVMVLYLYKEMQNNNYGLANAASVCLILVGVLVIEGIRLLFRDRHSEAAEQRRRERREKRIRRAKMKKELERRLG